MSGRLSLAVAQFAIRSAAEPVVGKEEPGMPDSSEFCIDLRQDRAIGSEPEAELPTQTDQLSGSESMQFTRDAI